MQILGKRVGGIDDEGDIVLKAEHLHLGKFHRSGKAHTMCKLNVLHIATGGIVVDGARLVEHLSRHASLGCAAKYQNHTSPLRNK